jgi:hypothetical protein
MRTSEFWTARSKYYVKKLRTVRGQNLAQPPPLRRRCSAAYIDWWKQRWIKVRRLRHLEAKYVAKINYCNDRFRECLKTTRWDKLRRGGLEL